MALNTFQENLQKFLSKQEEKKRRKKEKKRKKKKTKKTACNVNNDKIIKVKRKKVGRPKKRGPKKKRIRRKVIVKPKKYILYDFKIVTSLNNKQNGYVGQYSTYSDARAKFLELERGNENIIFPRKVLNSGKISKSKDEYLMLEKNRSGLERDGVTRNEFGKFTIQKISNNTKWIIRDKMERKVEETFWVYGFDPKRDRKTYVWILENLILNKLENSYDIIRIALYKNKLLIKYDNAPMNLVLCKNLSDCIRMYNMISEKAEKEKIRQIICVGAFNAVSEKRREIENDIMELTGWEKVKIQRSKN